ncbi:MAG: hypothetical protein ACRCYQ_02315 [Nocardioides sp.]
MPDILGFVAYQRVLAERARLAGAGNPGTLEGGAARLRKAAGVLARHDLDLGATRTQFARYGLRGATADAYLVAHERRVRAGRVVMAHLARDATALGHAAEAIRQARAETTGVTKWYDANAANITRAFNRLTWTQQRRALPAYRQAAADVIRAADSRLNDLTRRLRQGLAAATEELVMPAESRKPAYQRKTKSTVSTGSQGSSLTVDDKVTVPVYSWDGDAGTGAVDVFSGRTVTAGADGTGSQTGEQGVAARHTVPVYSDPTTGASVTASGQGGVTQQDGGSVGLRGEVGLKGTVPGGTSLVNFDAAASGEVREDTDPSGKAGAKALGSVGIAPNLGWVGTGNVEGSTTGDPVYGAGAGIGYGDSAAGVGVQHYYGTAEDGTDPKETVRVGGYLKPADDVTLTGTADFSDTTTVGGSVKVDGNPSIEAGVTTVLEDGTTEGKITVVFDDDPPTDPPVTWSPGEPVPMPEKKP